MAETGNINERIEQIKICIKEAMAKPVTEKARPNKPWISDRTLQFAASKRQKKKTIKSQMMTR